MKKVALAALAALGIVLGTAGFSSQANAVLQLRSASRKCGLQQLRRPVLGAMADFRWVEQ